MSHLHERLKDAQIQVNMRNQTYNQNLDILKDLKENSNKKQQLLENSINQAKIDGYDITFKGEFSQHIGDVNNTQKISVPFIIAQTSEDKQKLRKGLVFGRIYDLDMYSEIENGYINPKVIQFNKNYKFTERRKYNVPSMIRYIGSMDNHSYKGKWKTISDNKDEEASGEFHLTKLISFEYNIGLKIDHYFGFY